MPPCCHAVTVHPASTALLLLGYAMALPVLARFGRVLRGRHRMALFGHQIGMLLAASGWMLNRQTVLALLHLLWAITARMLAARFAPAARR
jgi:hypothetical protein